MVGAGLCAGLRSVIGLWWLAGTWPFGVVEGVWAVVAFRRWLRSRTKVQEEQGNGATCLPETVKAWGMGNKKAGHDDQPPG